MRQESLSELKDLAEPHSYQQAPAVLSRANPLSLNSLPTESGISSATQTQVKTEWGVGAWLALLHLDMLSKGLVIYAGHEHRQLSNNPESGCQMSMLTWVYLRTGSGKMGMLVYCIWLLQSHLLHGHCCVSAQEPTSLGLMFHHSLQQFDDHPTCWSSHTGAPHTSAY